MRRVRILVAGSRQRCQRPCVSDVFVNRDKTHNYVTRNTRIRANRPAGDYGRSVFGGQERTGTGTKPTAILPYSDKPTIRLSQIRDSTEGDNSTSTGDRRLVVTTQVSLALTSNHFRTLNYLQEHPLVAVQLRATRIGGLVVFGAAF